ncbi:AvrD family protein [Streptomyces sp. NPDC021622]|uniref:AvrD family protein n=1 Tax=Streptomyces sp. NPDC021622 TaxID=3155013 RepID=UPI0033C399EA
MTASSAQTVLTSVDDYLGPADRRFFGRGFRRVQYDIGDARVARTGNSVEALATVGVAYPADWSTKAAGTDLRPHFSTIDGLVVAAQLAEACLTGPGADLRDAWLRKVRLTAGSSPQEDLDRIPARATLRRTEPVVADPARAVSVVDCAIGTMRVRCEVEHARIGSPVRERTYTGLDALLGAPADRYFGTGFTARRQLIRDVSVDQERLRASAGLTVADEDATPLPTAGLEGAYQPSVSMVDAFVTALQLAQIMLYDLDGMRRQDSETLWMRQTTITASRPDRPRQGVPVTTHLADPDLLRMGGGTWRTLDVVAELAGLRVRSAVAHRLPEGHVAA